MRILVLSPSPLYPVKNGLDQRIFNLLKPLSGEHEFTLLALSEKQDPAAAQAESLREVFLKITLISHDDSKLLKKGKIQSIYEWFSPADVSLGSWSMSRIMREELPGVLKDRDFDLIFAASPFMINYLLDINHIPIVLDVIDDTSLLFRRNITHAKGILRKSSAIKDWLVIRKIEKKFYSRFKEMVVSSSKDAAILKSFCPQSSISVIPNCVDYDYFDQPHGLASEPILIFTGVMNYEPNAAAAKHFAENIFPIIRKKVPGIKFYVVGRNPVESVRRLSDDNSGIEVTGEVDDLRPYMYKSRVYVCPLLSGAGIKFKLLEAWASGMPVVATSLSCDGIDVSPGNDVLVADNPGEFGARVIDLLENDQLCRDLAANGRKKARELYSWEKQSHELNGIFIKAVSDFKRRVNNNV